MCQSATGIYTGSGWSNTLAAAGVKNLALLAIGDARCDGTNRVCFTEFESDGALYEAERIGDNWSVMKVDDTYPVALHFYRGRPE